MASVSLCSSGLFLPISHYSPSKCCIETQALALNQSRFLSSNSVLRFKRQILVSTVQFKKLRSPRPPQVVPTVLSAQSNFLKGKLPPSVSTNFLPYWVLSTYYTLL